MKVALLLAALLISACATFPEGDVEPDPCTSQGGVWYKAPLSDRYECVDRYVLQEQLKRII